MPPASSPALASIPLTNSIAPYGAAKAAWLVDIWGVIHNGVQPFMEACDACARYRTEGGVVALVSNSPRPNESVRAQLDGIGVPRAAYDAIVTSGDVARSLIAEFSGRPIFHIGPERDLATFAGLDVVRVMPDDADAVVCTGLFDDERETPDDYAETLATCLARDLPMVCANPDIMVERGGRMIYCAGAIARKYEAMGGKVAYAGKPYLPIYDLTFATLETLKPGSSRERAELLAIGDGIGTDIAGAATAGLPAVFVASGVHVKGALDEAAIGELFPLGSPRPIAAMTKLAW